MLQNFIRSEYVDLLIVAGIYETLHPRSRLFKAIVVGIILTLTLMADS